MSEYSIFHIFVVICTIISLFSPVLVYNKYSFGVTDTYNFIFHSLSVFIRGSCCFLSVFGNNEHL